MKIRSRLPVTYFIWILASLGILITLIIQHKNLLYLIIATVILSTVLYFVLARYACTIELQDSLLTIKYVFPGGKDIVLDLRNVTEVRIDLSYFFFLSEDHGIRYDNWFHPYDTLTFIGQDGETSINVNTTYIGTLKLCRYFKKELRRG